MTLSARRSTAIALLLAAPLPSQGAAPVTAADVVACHAGWCHDVHARAALAAERMQAAIRTLLQAPDAASLRAARQAWIAARAVYCQLEALRFHGGPIDAVEPLLNAWPVDEAYIEQIAGQPTGGIVHDAQRYPVLSGPLLLHLNERGGETNVSVGWHAIEFLLWGQDLDPSGPGNRPHTDFIAEGGPANRRRSSYLALTTDLLVGQLRQLADDWAPAAGAGEDAGKTGSFRHRFVADPRSGVRRMLTGALILTAFELAGERLSVAYETRDQEQEHSCFSDNTCADLVANQLGILAVFRGGAPQDGRTTCASLLRWIGQHDAAIAAHLERCLDDSLAALRAIPAPFDQAFLGADDAPGRTAIRQAIAALEQQAEAIAIAGRLLGFDLPVRPGN